MQKLIINKKSVIIMKKRYAVITDIHGNIEALSEILKDIKDKNVDDVFCLGDIIGIGPNSKECVNMLIDNNVKSILGNQELYLIKGTDIGPSIVGEEKGHYKWIKESLTEKEINYIKGLPLFYEIIIDYDGKIDSKKFVLCHYLIADEKAQYPFEKSNLKNEIDLWIKYNNPDITYIIGYLHKSFDPNEVEGIEGDYIEELQTLPNIEIVNSAGCSPDEYVSYLLIEIDKSIIFKNIKVKFDRKKFIEKITNTDFPDKKNILKCFYGTE